MAVNLSPVGGVAAQFFNNNGVILSGGKIFTYASGTTTNQTTYTSSSGATAHTNPIILDSAGRVPSGEIWLTDGVSYKFVFTDSNDVLIGTYDNINGINSTIANFTTEQEFQTATAGQTVFNLTTMEYQPATNSLSVFVDGVNQYGPGAQYSYVETDSNTVTFNAGLHVGAEVKFTTSNINSTAGGAAAGVSFTGFKGQTGNVQDIADDDGSDWIGFEPVGASVVARSVEDKLRETISVADYPDLQTAIATATANNFFISVTENTTVRIPTDAPTLQNAIDHIYINGNETQVTLHIESGHQLTAPLLCKNKNFEDFLITSADPSVQLIPGFVGIPNQTEFGEGIGLTDSALIYLDNAHGPTIGTVFDLEQQATVQVGFAVCNASVGMVKPNCGFINASEVNAFVVSAKLNARSGVFSGAGREGLRARVNSLINAPEADFSGCVTSLTSAVPAVFISRSSVAYINDIDVSNSGGYGVSVHRSFASCESANISNAQEIGLEVDTGSFVNAAGVDVSNCGTNAIRAQRSYVTCRSANVSGAGSTQILISFGGIVAGSSLTFTGLASDISNVPANTVAGVGMFLYEDEASPLREIGIFSATGANNGKTFGSSSVLDSSRNATSTQLHQRFYNANGQVGNISTSGTGTSYAVTSNENYKNFIGEYDAQKAINIIKSDPVRDWNWTPEKGGGYAVGWGAQTSYKVSPDLATKGGWYLNGEEVAPGTEDAEYVEWGVDQGKRTPYLWAAVSYLIDEVETLRAMLDDKK